MAEQQAATRTIGWIGAGVMGAPMAAHLMSQGHQLRVHTRTKKKAAKLLDAGATWASTPLEAAEGADVVCSIVGFPADVEAVHLGEEGTLAARQAPKILIDFTTSSPSLAMRIAEAAGAKGVSAIDAPVSGGDIGARNATLSIMVGGSEDAVQEALPLMSCLGKRVVRQGGPGAGQHTKMVNQILIASTMVGACEGLIYAEAAGLDPTTVIESVGAGAAGSWTINELGPRMIQGDLEPGFFVEHFIKDLDIALREASRLRLALPGLAQARQFYEAVRAKGHARKGTQALIAALRNLSSR